MIKPIHIVGGGMAGSEAAWQIVSAGIPVIIHEMRPSVETFAHQTHDLAELVCSNSFRSDDDESNAVGLLVPTTGPILSRLQMRFTVHCRPSSHAIPIPFAMV